MHHTNLCCNDLMAYRKSSGFFFLNHNLKNTQLKQTQNDSSRNKLYERNNHKLQKSKGLHSHQNQFQKGNLTLSNKLFHTSFCRPTVNLETSMGLRVGTSTKLTSGTARAHTTCAQFPSVVGFIAPPRSTHRQHSYQKGTTNQFRCNILCKHNSLKLLLTTEQSTQREKSKI